MLCATSERMEGRERFLKWLFCLNHLLKNGYKWTKDGLEMDKKKAFTLWLTCLYFFIPLRSIRFLIEAGIVNGNPDAKRLYDDLISRYNKLVRPVHNVSDPLTVHIKLKLSQLIEVVSSFSLHPVSSFLFILHCIFYPFITSLLIQSTYYFLFWYHVLCPIFEMSVGSRNRDELSSWWRWGSLVSYVCMLLTFLLELKGTNVQ